MVCGLEMGHFFPLTNLHILAKNNLPFLFLPILDRIWTNLMGDTSTHSNGRNRGLIALCTCQLDVTRQTPAFLWVFTLHLKWNIHAICLERLRTKIGRHAISRFTKENCKKRGEWIECIFPSLWKYIDNETDAHQEWLLLTDDKASERCQSN